MDYEYFININKNLVEIPECWEKLIFPNQSLTKGEMCSIINSKFFFKK